MGQSNQRSVPLKAVSFTAPIVVNKGNQIRILSPQAVLDLIVEECIVFSFLEPVSMLIPAQATLRLSQNPEAHSKTGDNQPLIETISVERVFHHRLKKAENRLTAILRESPRQILFCRVKNLTVAKKIVADPSGAGQLATVIYHYQVEVEYQDATGQIKKDYFDSGTRYQQVSLEPPARSFNVAINCLCSIK